MSENEANKGTQKKARIVASAKLSEDQVQQALMQFTTQDENLREIVENQETVAWVNWHVNKWDTPETFCTISFGVVINDSDESIEESVAEPKDER